MPNPPEAQGERVAHILQRCGQQPSAQALVANNKRAASFSFGVGKCSKHAFFR
jgi:hypothetical protein